MAEKKTSEEWYNQVDKPSGLIIYDPDGWDRKNWQFSWYEEKITIDEYRNRVFWSTCLFEKIE